MLVRNHVVFGAGSWMAFEHFVLSQVVGSTPLGYVVAIALSTVMDIDTNHSFIGRRLPVLSHLIRFVFGHRGLTHSAIAVAITGVALHLSNYNMISN